MPRRILIQLDSDPQPSVFDRVVAIDAGADEVFSYGGVTLEQVTGLVHGAIFTRSPADLQHTAIFLGGSDVAMGQRMLERVLKTFLGPMRVGVMLDANGCNTTAAAAVLAARRHVTLAGSKALVLGGTGPVGQRAAQLMALEGARVTLASRSLEKATHAADHVNQLLGPDRAESVQPARCETHDELRALLAGQSVVIAAGAAGVQLLPASLWQEGEATRDLRVLIDLNAVPPLGIEGVDLMDKGKSRQQVVTYGAIGVGGSKMKIHRAAVASLFSSTQTILDAPQIYALGRTL